MEDLQEPADFTWLDALPSIDAVLAGTNRKQMRAPKVTMAPRGPSEAKSKTRGPAVDRPVWSPWPKVPSVRAVNAGVAAVGTMGTREDARSTISTSEESSLGGSSVEVVTGSPLSTDPPKKPSFLDKLARWTRLGR